MQLPGGHIGGVSARSPRCEPDSPGQPLPLPPRRANLTTAIVNYAFCCPSRASILTGACSHNTGVISNTPPYGGVSRFVERGLEFKAAPYLLQQAGYRTGLVGKVGRPPACASCMRCNVNEGGRKAGQGRGGKRVGPPGATDCCMQVRWTAGEGQEKDPLVTAAPQ